MNTYRKKNYRGKRGYSGRPHRRSVDNYHQPLPPDRDVIPYARHTLTKPDVEAVVDALLSGTLTQGRELERFESLLAKLTHSEHAIGLNSGTAAIHAALACLKLEAEDEVITSTLNFCAVANMVRLVGAKPVLVDCDAETLTIDVEATRAAVTEHTKAIVANNFGGHPANLTALREICDEHGLMLIEDASHGLGGKYRGHYVGNQADITCFSFHPSKAITTCEGGAVTTNNRAVADWIRLFRHHGIQKDSRYFKSGEDMPSFHQELQFMGMNYRLSEVHAALGRSQLTRLDRHIERRRSIAQVYYQKLGNIQELQLPFVANWADSAFHIFPIRLKGGLEQKRNEIFEELRAKKIEVQYHYIPVHRMPLYAGLLGTPEDFPNAEAYYECAFTLPLFPDLSYKDIERITELLIKLVNKFKPHVEGEEDNQVDSDDTTDRDDSEENAFDRDYSYDGGDDEDDDDSDDWDGEEDDSDDDDDDRPDFDEDDDDDDDSDDDDDDSDDEDSESEDADEDDNDDDSDDDDQEDDVKPAADTKPTRKRRAPAAKDADAEDSAEADEDSKDEAEEEPKKPARPRRATRGRPRKTDSDAPKTTRRRTTRTSKASASDDGEKEAKKPARRGRPRKKKTESSDET